MRKRFSPIARAGYSLDAGPWQLSSRWAGSPTRSENTTVAHLAGRVSGKISEHLIAVRVYDRRENVGVAKTVIAGEK